MTDDMVNIEVDGKPGEARKGQMIMEVTDSVGTYVPRFCYHEKLSIAANCRMCLVEVEKEPKPMPACATPVMEGMKVFTRSPAAIAAQKATMEFLLINHPLDCPICDQGGECELQDLALGYGRDVSRYNERKRVVGDKDIGPLVSTDMTRCIHCTRCVRFGEEVTGLQQLGTTERGENMKIGTYVEKSIDHELSANIIDLCPVGALNNKPYRYSARAWEMTQRTTISPHDCVGSNMNAHVLRGAVKRVVPHENEVLNETWLSDRDRFSYEGIYSSDRLAGPRLKSGDTWEDVSWEEAFACLANEVGAASAEKVGMLASPSSTIEELHLLSLLADSIGTSNIDYRVRQCDFGYQDNEPLMPWLGCNVADIETAGAILVVGSNLRKEASIIAHRVRKAAVAGSVVSIIDTVQREYFFDTLERCHGKGLVAQLAEVVVAAADNDSLPAPVARICKDVKPGQEHQNIAKSLSESGNALILTGLIAGRYPATSAVRALVAALGDLTGASVGTLSEGSNSAGASIAGVLPHRTRGGKRRSSCGLNATEILQADLDVTFLLGLEPEDLTCIDEVAARLTDHKFVVALTPFTSESLEKSANLLLPIGTFAETSGTYVNCEGSWQSFSGIAKPVGEARPGWKVLRVIGNLLDAEGFDYPSSEEVRDELIDSVGDFTPDNTYRGTTAIETDMVADDPAKAVDVPIYQVDGLVRRAAALQLTPDALRIKDQS